jgi:hypothetical protein
MGHGADGPGSVVRHVPGLGFKGGSYELAFFLADVALAWAIHPAISASLSPTPAPSVRDAH